MPRIATISALFALSLPMTALAEEATRPIGDLLTAEPEDVFEVLPPLEHADPLVKQTLAKAKTEPAGPLLLGGQHCPLQIYGESCDFEIGVPLLAE